MKTWQYSLSVITINPDHFPASELTLNELGKEGWEAITAVPMSGITGMGKAVVLCRREVRRRRASSSVRAA